MNALFWNVAALLISIPTTLPFSQTSHDAVSSPIPGHRVTEMTCTWGKTESQWLTIVWWQDTLPPYPGQPIEVLETWPVKFLNQASTANRVRSAGSTPPVNVRRRDDSYFLFTSKLASNKAYIKIASGGMSKEGFTNLVQSIQLRGDQPIKDEALTCEQVKP